MRPGFGIVILAAGNSSRMGRPKLLLPWGGTSIIGHQIGVWRELRVRQIAVVHRPDDLELLRELDRAGLPKKNRIQNPRPDEEMIGSIKRAAKWNGWNPEFSHFVISLGDQPHLKSETFEALLRFSAANPATISQPLFENRARHPVVLPKHIFQKLAVTEAKTLKDFLAGKHVVTIELSDPGLALDIDEPADYEKALAACWKNERPLLK